MKVNQILNAWNRSESTDALTSAAGIPIVDEAILNQVGGGTLPSSGYICTLSGECNGTGKSCWPWSVSAGPGDN